RSEKPTQQPPADHLPDDAAGRGVDRGQAAARDSERCQKERASMIMRQLLFLLLISTAAGQTQYDLLLKGGHVIDARNNLNAIRDVAIAQGKIAAVAANISGTQARKTIDVSGLYVSPGLVDMHVHVFAGSMGREYIGE